VTTLHVHELTGLKPDALATYLTGLGVLRLLAEQRDAEVRAFWRDEHFVLVTKLDWSEIEKFFLADYAPTPILAPWNKESGFFSLKPASESPDVGGESLPVSGTDDPSEGAAEDPGSDDEAEEEVGDETEQAVGDPLLDRFGSSGARRFAALRQAIEIARATIPDDVRRAEDAVRSAHEEIRKRLAVHRDAFEKALQKLKDAERLVAAANVAVGATKEAAKHTARSAHARAELQAAQQRLKEVREREKTARKEKQGLERELKEAAKQAARNPELKAQVAEAKKRFKEVQSSTKERLIADLRAKWRPEGQQWVDAAVALDESGMAAFTSLFGSGGNDGRMEFTKNFRRHLDALFDSESGAAKDKAADRLRAAVFRSPQNVLITEWIRDGKKQDVAVGQLFPGRAGGANQGIGFGGTVWVNPWEFILMLEGAVALVAGMSRRGEVGRARVSSPFWVEAAAAGFGSASEREGSLRGEQWLPLWSQPLRYAELVELIREGRAQVGHRQATRAGDLVRATARLGLARGIDSLQRFAYLQRNGQSNLAVFTGRFQVRSRSRQLLLDEIAPWIERLVGWAKEKTVPASLGVIARRTQDALFAVCRQDATAKDWRALLIVLGKAELALLRSGKNPTRRPLPRLSSGWIAAVDDATPHGGCALRLALALASQHRPIAKGEVRFTDSIRRHFVPLAEPDASRPRFKLDERGRPVPDPEHVCVGRDLVADAIALVERRSVWARTSWYERTPRLPLQATRHCEATLEEVGAWVRGEVPDTEVLDLVRPLLALDWTQMPARSLLLAPEPGGVPEPLHLLFCLAHLPFDVPVTDAEQRTEAAIPVRLDPEPVRRLAAGDIDGALRLTVRRLEASGLRPVFRRGVATPALARRLAASLAFPISQQDAARAARLVCKPHDEKDVGQQSAVLV
jgi:CRISPR-associated protein Csx17